MLHLNKNTLFIKRILLLAWFVERPLILLKQLRLAGESLEVSLAQALPL